MGLTLLKKVQISYKKDITFNKKKVYINNLANRYCKYFICLIQSLKYYND